MKNNFNIVLSSSGYNDINNFVSEKSKKLFAQIARNKKIMILANAAPVNSGNYVARENVAENFKKAGATQADIIDLDNKNMELMDGYDVIYGLGGDPALLIELVNKTDFKKHFIDFLKKGIYIGESAGSMIMADDLKWVYYVKKGSKPKYNITLDTYKGLGLTKKLIFPHVNKEGEQMLARAQQYESENGVSFTRLNDGEYITELVLI